MRVFRVIVAAVAACLGLGCAADLPATTVAARVERIACPGGTDQATDLAAVTTMPVVAVDGIYYRDTCAGVAQVQGTTLVVSGPMGWSPQRLASALRCHGARVLEGKEAPVQASDPYWIPDGWVDIQVEADSGAERVTLRAGSIRGNIEVLRKARAFATEQRSTPHS